MFYANITIQNTFIFIKSDKRGSAKIAIHRVRWPQLDNPERNGYANFDKSHNIFVL